MHVLGMNMDAGQYARWCSCCWLTFPIATEFMAHHTAVPMQAVVRMLQWLIPLCDAKVFYDARLAAELDARMQAQQTKTEHSAA